MTFVFLGSAASHGRSLTNRPILFQLANPEHSQLVAGLQYLASLLFGNSSQSRLQILFSSSHASLAEWEHESCGDVRVLRRMVLLTVSWMQRRLCDRLAEPPFSLVAMADTAAPDSLRRDLARKWDDLNRCCVRPGFAAKMKQRNVSGDDILNQPKLLSSFEFGPFA